MNLLAKRGAHISRMSLRQSPWADILVKAERKKWDRPQMGSCSEGPGTRGQHKGLSL